MVRGLRNIRTMREVWDERRKTPPSRPGRPSVVRRFALSSHAQRHRPPRGAKAVRTWVFSKTPAGKLPERQLLVKRTKEPEVDLFHEEDELIVLADLPGVSKQDIRVAVEKDLLIIEAVSTGPQGKVHCYKEVMLPYEVRKNCDLSYKGSVLEVHLRPKRGAERRAGSKKTKIRRAAGAAKPGKKNKGRRRKGESEKEAKGKAKTLAKKGRRRKSSGPRGGSKRKS